MFHIDWLALLNERNLTIKDLSDKTGISYRRLYHMIAEEADFVSRSTLGCVLLKLGVEVQPPFYLIDESEELAKENQANDNHAKRPYRSYQRRTYRRRPKSGSD